MGLNRLIYLFIRMYVRMSTYIYRYMCICLHTRVILEESVILWEMIVCVILSKKVHMNMGPVLNGYGVTTA